MTEYELETVRKAVAIAITDAGPRLADTIKIHIAESVVRRLRQQFNIPSPVRSDSQTSQT